MTMGRGYFTQKAIQILERKQSGEPGESQAGGGKLAVVCRSRRSPKIRRTILQDAGHPAGQTFSFLKQVLETIASVEELGLEGRGLRSHGEPYE